MDSLKIPVPPSQLLEDLSAGGGFVPDPAIGRFVDDAFFDEKSLLFNPEHGHLSQASIGFLWTSILNKRRGRIVAGECDMPANYKTKGGKWIVGRLEFQLMQWFGEIPDFVVTINAGQWNDGDDAGRLALLEHELYHCGQAVDMFGMPKFSKSTGRPIFAIRGHDVEEFSAVVRRYGIEAAGQDRVDFVAAALAEPEIARATIAVACGTCVV
jgi:hypothetical protein